MKKLCLIFLLLQALSMQAQVPEPAFTADKVSGCAGLQVTFTDQSTGNPTSWTWNLGNGHISSEQNPTTTYTQAGTYSVQLVVQNADGTKGITKTDYITIYPAPRVNFSADRTTACAPATIKFSDLSTVNGGAVTQWSWNFGDGSTSTQQNPSKTYTQNGFYSVSLRATSTNGCQSTATKTRFIRITTGITADFSSTITPSCEPPYDVSFTNLTSGPGELTFQWNLGNGSTSTQTHPTNIYNNAGNFTIALNVQSEYGCSASIQKNLQLDDIHTVINHPDTVCLNAPVTFQSSAAATPTGVAWDLGNGTTAATTTASATYTTPGDYPVSLISQYAQCTDTTSTIVTVIDKPTVNFTAVNRFACAAPLSVNFQDQSPDAIAWNWDFGDGSSSAQQNPVHQYNATGTYAVTLTITNRNGCTNSLTKNSYVQIVRPTVQINDLPAKGCVPFTFQPTATATSVDGIASYAWNFGDGSTGSGATPSHVYPNPGNYNVQLTVTTTGGCTATTSVSNAVHTGTPPVVNFTASNTDVCAETDISFTDLSTPTGAVQNLDGWYWDFGDATSSEEQHPVHNYIDTGYFDVSLTVYNNGCPAIYTMPRYIHINPPVARFSYAVSCTVPTQVSFTNESVTDPAYGPISYQWDFGNGITSSQADTVVNFPALGTYTISLTVINGSCSHTLVQNIQLVRESADFTVTPSPVCKNTPFTVQATPKDPAAISRYTWTLGSNPAVDGGQSITRTFANNGVYPVTLTITDINGCTNTKTVNDAITVIGPYAGFSPDGVGACRDSAVSFTDQSTSADGLVKWTWDFGDGQQQSFTTAPFAHTYADTGAYTVQLTVEDVNGCTDRYTLPATVKITRPAAHFTADYTLICSGVEVQFTDTSGGDIVSYAWDFGDGNTATMQNPQHAYPAKDTSYTVSLIVQDIAGCTDTLVQNNYMAVKDPKPDFTAQDTVSICPLLETSFFFNGQDYESWYWDFGDGATSTLFNPTHFYNDYGSYTAQLVLVGYGGCLDSSAVQVNVYDPGKDASMTYSPVTACNTITVDFDLTVPDYVNFTFSFGDGTQDSSQNTTLQHFYDVPKVYNPSLLLKDALNCQATIPSSTPIHVLGAKPLFGIDQDEFCDTGTVTFTNYKVIVPDIDPLISDVWDFGDGTTSDDLNPVHQYTAPGTYVVAHTVTTQNCFNTLYDTIQVYRRPTPVIQLDSVVCINDVIYPQGNLLIPDTAVTWHWDLGNGTTADVQNPSAQYTTAGNYTLSLTAGNLPGCEATVYKDLLVAPLPVITILDNPVIVVGTGTTLPVSYSPNVIQYQWTPADYLSCTSCSNPFANPVRNKTYSVWVQDVNGCQNTGEIRVTVVCNEQNYFLPNTFSPNGDGNNDLFYPRGKSITRINSMSIFSRWGEKVFERRNFFVNDKSAGWDGTIKGKKAAADVYVYIIEFVCDNGEIIPVKGNITLIR